MIHAVLMQSISLLAEFRSGLMLYLRSDTSVWKQRLTYCLGKSTLIEIIHFCLGATFYCALKDSAV